MKEIVSIQWLNDNLNDPNIVILDASISANAKGEKFEKPAYTIPDAIPFDLKNVFSDQLSAFPNTVPSPEKFELECQKLGINQHSKIVAFDNNGIFSSPRVWWLFHVMGHSEIAVLDGGLPHWVENKYPVVNDHMIPSEKGNFKANYNPQLVVSFDEMQRNVVENTLCVVDARSAGRFNGTAPEPRKHLKSGKIENSVNLPFENVLTNGKFKSKSELKTIFDQVCNGKKDVVFSCGSGMTACIIMLASCISYGNSQKVYDGSWTEWAERNHLIV